MYSLFILFYIRKLIVFLLLLVIIAGCCLIITNKIQIFVPVNDQDLLSTTTSLISTTTQSLSSILGITIAVLFITAQIIIKPRQTRVLSEIYSNIITLLVLLFYIIAIITGIITLAYLPSILQYSDFRLIDLTILLGIVAVFSLGPLVLVQIENMHPYYLGIKLSRKITINRILAYQLISIEINPQKAGYYIYKLQVWGLYHHVDDPLGPLHEVIMVAVETKDRILLFALNRVLLKIIARSCGVPYSYNHKEINYESGLTRYSLSKLYCHIKSRNTLQNKISVSIHIIHYIIRRAQNLRREWDNRDIVRQAFILNLYDLIKSLNLRTDTCQLIDICLYATMHLSLSYAHIPPYGRLEPLTRYFQLAVDLYNKQKKQQAYLCSQILGYLSIKTDQIPIIYELIIVNQPHQELTDMYLEAKNMASLNRFWIPGEDSMDPWRYMVKSYQTKDINQWINTYD